MHPCVHASMHPCVHASMHPCIHASMHPCIYAFLVAYPIHRSPLEGRKGAIHLRPMPGRVVDSLPICLAARLELFLQLRPRLPPLPFAKAEPSLPIIYHVCPPPPTTCMTACLPAVLQLRPLWWPPWRPSRPRRWSSAAGPPHASSPTSPTAARTAQPSARCLEWGSGNAFVGRSACMEGGHAGHAATHMTRSSGNAGSMDPTLLWIQH